MTLIEMLVTNIEPTYYKHGLYIRKRLFHPGYEVLVKFDEYYIHYSYIKELE